MRNAIPSLCLSLSLCLFFAAEGYAQQSRCDPLDLDCQIEAISRLIAANPTNATAYAHRGVLKAMRDDHSKAILDFTEAIYRANGQQAVLLKAHHHRAMSYKLSGYPNQAIADYTAAIGFDPKNARFLFERGLLLVAEGEDERALADFAAAGTLDPHFTKAINFRGSMHRRMGQRKKAFTDFNQAIRVDPNDPEAYFNRAYEYAERKEYLKAVSDYDKYIALNAAYPWTLASAFRNRASAYQNLGDKTKALADYNKAVELEPNSAKYIRARAAYYRSVGMKSYAEVDERRALEMGP